MGKILLHFEANHNVNKGPAGGKHGAEHFGGVHIGGGGVRMEGHEIPAVRLESHFSPERKNLHDGNKNKHVRRLRSN